MDYRSLANLLLCFFMVLLLLYDLLCISPVFYYFYQTMFLLSINYFFTKNKKENPNGFSVINILSKAPTRFPSPRGVVGSVSYLVSTVAIVHSKMRKTFIRYGTMPVFHFCRKNTVHTHHLVHR